MSVGCQITNGYGLRTKSEPSLCRLPCDQAGMVEWNSAHTASLCDVVRIKPKASETYGCARHCKQTVQGSSNTLHICYTPALGPGQCRTPLIHRLYSIHWGPDALGHALWAGLSTDCGLLHHHHHHHHQNAGFRVAHNNVNYCWGTLHSQVTCWLQKIVRT